VALIHHGSVSFALHSLTSDHTAQFSGSTSVYSFSPESMLIVAQSLSLMLQPTTVIVGCGVLGPSPTT
jgi:hypothetical protein